MAQVQHQENFEHEIAENQHDHTPKSQQKLPSKQNVSLAAQPDQQDHEQTVEEHHQQDRKASIDQIKNLTHTVNEQLIRSSHLISGTPQRTNVSEAQSSTSVHHEKVTSTKSHLAVDQIRLLNQAVSEQLAKSSLLRNSAVRTTVTEHVVRPSAHLHATSVALSNTSHANTHYKSLSDLSMGLTSLHQQVDKIISRAPHHTTALRTSHLPIHTTHFAHTAPVEYVNRSLYSSTYVPSHTHYVHEVSPLHGVPTYYSRETSPSRTVQTTYYVPHAQTTYTSPVKASYDVKKLDTLVSSIVGARASTHHAVHHYTAPVKHEYSQSAILTRDIYTPAKVHQEVAVNARRYAAEKYACGDAENDVDSMILDRIEPENDRRHNNEEEYNNYFTSPVQDDQEEEEPAPAQLTKRREILNQRRSLRNSQVEQPAVQNNASQAAEKEVKAAPKNSELLMKGPYDQKNKQGITVEKAQQYFNKDEKNIADFKF